MSGIYIHIPFCHAKCYYCDFYSTPKKDLYDAFTDRLIKEWHDLKDFNLQYTTLYLGGGTPSILPVKNLKKIFKLFESTPFQEVTIEVNPEDVNSDFIKILNDSPVNRISMGVQSFVDKELQSVGRRHSAKTAENAIDLIKKYDFKLSIDLIFGLPYQTTQSWEYSLDKSFSICPHHLSCYLLSVENKTKLQLLLKQDKISIADEDKATELYNILCRKAADKNYEHYEISNFCNPGYRAMHNSNYWNLTPYLGLGPGAHSFDGKNRYSNPSNIKDYLQATEDFRIKEQLTNNDRFNEYIMIRLRTSDGLNLDKTTSLFGERNLSLIRHDLKKHIELNNLIQTGSTLRIPEDKWLMSDMIISDLFL